MGVKRPVSTQEDASNVGNQDAASAPDVLWGDELCQLHRSSDFANADFSAFGGNIKPNPVTASSTVPAAFIADSAGLSDAGMMQPTTTDTTGLALNLGPITPLVYPYDAVCRITVTFSSGQQGQGSGVIIGPHTILTASHVLWQAPYAATAITVYPGYENGGASISGAWIDHYHTLNDSGDYIDPSGEYNDYAVIDVAQDLWQYGSFGILPNYQGGTVHVTGYPYNVNNGGTQVDQTGTVGLLGSLSLLDWSSDLGIMISNGNSGGPVSSTTASMW